MSQVHDELAELTADIKAWIEWAKLTGAEVLPREPVEPLVAVPIDAQAGRLAAKVPERSTPQSAVSTQAPEPVAPRLSMEREIEKSKPNKPTKASAKWAALMDAPTSYTASGPREAKLVIVRGSGSSAEAESMLDRMLANVLRVERGNVAVIDLIRDSRSPADIGSGVRAGLESYSADVILVMGNFAAKALFGDASTVSETRGAWRSDARLGAIRVTHHPEGILALSSRGEHTAKRETFDDLKAVAERLS